MKKATKKKRQANLKPETKKATSRIDSWRILADHVDLNEQSGFDELCVGQWFHLERMDTRSWWMGVGDEHFWFYVQKDGTVKIDREKRG